MKKIIFLFLILFSSILVVNADSTFYLGEKVTDMYVESIKGSDKHNGAPFLIQRSDGKIVYCINPFKMMSEIGTYKSYTYNDPIFNLTDEQLNKLNIIGYFGYGYSDHTEKKWYGITQYLMWKSLDFEDVYFTDSYYGSRVEKYTNEVRELETLINNYLKLPSFANNNYEYDPNSSYEIVDNNNVLSNYEIKESNIDASISDNKLKIKTSNIGEYQITFIRKSPINRNYELYSLDGHQELLYPGKIDDITFSITVKVKGGSITINKLDREKKERLEANLSEAVINLGKGNIWIRSEKVNEDGSVTFSNLPVGIYQIQEHRPSIGYNLVLKTYTIAVYDNQNTVHNLYSDVIEGNLIINKYYGSENNYKLDENSVFEVYHNNILVKTLKPVNGVIKEKLEYGTYLVKQTGGTKYYDFAEDFTISITENKNYTYNFYTEMEEELKVFFDEKNSSLTLKQEELNNLQNELKEKENKLNQEKEKLKLQEEELIKLKEEIEKEQKLLEIKTEQMKNKVQELDKLEEELNLLSNRLEVEQKTLIEFKKKIETKEMELNNLKRELDLLNNNLIKKENSLTELKANIDNRQIEINKKEQELINLEKKVEEKNVLVVEVPNTFKRSYKKLISKILIFVGSIIIIYRKKVPNY